MFLNRFIFWLRYLLFPRYAAKKAQKEKAEIQLLGQQLFFGQKINAIFPHLKIHQNVKSEKWIVKASDRIDAYLLLNVLPSMSCSAARYMSDRIVITVPISTKSTLMLTEYLCPIRTRLGLCRQDEVLFARAVVLTGDETKNIMDFYIDAAMF